jgi:teichuronic acid biosynthesis glycosyltransferase TuaC
MLRVLTLSTLFPDASRPNFGVFVERQTRALAALPDVDLRVVAPIGLPLFPLDRMARHRALAAQPRHERWHDIDVCRPRFVTVPGTGGRFHVAALLRALVPLLDRVRAGFAFDVIDAEFFFPDGPVATALGRRYRVPVSIKARGADIHHWGHGPTAAQVRRAGRRAAGMLAVSAAMKRDMVALGLDPARILVHPTGLDHERFQPRDRMTAKAALAVTGALVVSVGALIPRKRHDIVIDALAELPDTTLLIAGDGPERAALQARIDRLGLGNRARLLGSVAHDDLPGLLAAADVMALASSSEGLANAWVEALACGTPVVITDVGGARELLTDDRAGRIVPATPAAFASAIAAMLAAPPARERVCAAAAPFSWSANAAALAAHLRSLVDADRQRQAKPAPGAPA